MSEQMKEWSSHKLRKQTTSVFYILTLISRALSRDDILKLIMKTAEHFRDIYGKCEYEALGCAVSENQSVIRDKLALSAKVTQSDDDDDEFDWVFDIWEFINDILDGEIFEAENPICSHVLTKRGVELILFYMRNAEAWRRDNIYRSIKKIANQKVKHVSLQKALKYAIGQSKFEILLHLEKPAEEDDNDESESDQCIYFHDLKEDRFTNKRNLLKERLFNYFHPVVKEEK